MRIQPIAGALLLCAPCLSFAQATAGPGEENTRQLDPVLVTATRTPRPQSATLAPHTVITRADIERTQARSVRELLRRSPGISIANQGGAGKITELRLRGTESDHVLVLVDGVRYNSATSGLAAIQDLPVEQIERIEVVRGPRSSLYGSEAIGGVIQIFTREGGGEAAPYFSVGGGRYDTYEGQAGVSGGSERANYNVSLSATDTDGFDACADPAACFTTESDDDGYSRTAGSVRAGYRLDNGLQLDVHALRTEGDTEFDGTQFGGNKSETLRQVFGLSASGRPVDAWRMALSLGRSRDESENFFDGQFLNAIESVRNSVTLQNDVTLASDDLLSFGLDYRHAQVDRRVNPDSLLDPSNYEKTRRDNVGAYTQYIGRWGDHELQLAGRGDDNEQFGEHATGSITWGWDFTAAHTLTASYGTAFKAPTFDELYFPGLSNPDLEPEESRTAEIGLLGNQRWGRWALHVYETRVDELIAFYDPTPNDPFNPDATVENISETRQRGVEAEAGGSIAGWQVNANATWLDAENRANGPDHGNELPRRPEYSAQLDLDRPFGRYSAGVSLFAASSTYDDVANNRRLDGYELVDLRASVRLDPAWRLQARLSNLLDEDYETAGFYNQPGRSLFVTLRYQP